MKIMVLSDVKRYQGLPQIVEAVKPSHVVIAGDVLYDGKGQVYVNENGEVVEGNTHEDRELLKRHMDALRAFLYESLDKGVEQVLLVYGDHDVDENVNFRELIKSWGLEPRRVVDVSSPIHIDVNNISVFFLPYIQSFEELRWVLRESRSVLEAADVFITHLELSKLRVVAWHLQKRRYPILLVSGHHGYGYYPPGKAWINLVANHLRILRLVEDRLPEGKVDGRQLRLVYESVLEEELEKHRWLVEDKLVHLARVDASPLSFLVLEESEHSIKGSLYFLEIKVPRKHSKEYFCEVKDSAIKLPAPLNTAFSNYADKYKVCEFTISRS